MAEATVALSNPPPKLEPGAKRQSAKRAAIYTRVSTADQHPETQLYDLREMAKQRGYEIVHEYSDVISGSESETAWPRCLDGGCPSPPLRSDGTNCPVRRLLAQLQESGDSDVQSLRDTCRILSRGGARSMQMRKRIASATAVTALLLILASRTVACSWAIGHFDQVTSLRGTVVGSRFPVLHSFRWFRQSVVRRRAKLTLYRYCWPCDVRHLSPVKTVVTGKDGKFDFGMVEPGHYYLEIYDEQGSLYDWFEVEVKGLPKPKESVTIDISPVRPDCSGGHEFVIKAN